MNKIPKRIPTKIFDRALAGSDDHFNLVIQIELEFDAALDEQRLARAVALTMEAEPILGCRFAPRMFRPFWERVEIEPFDVFILTDKKNEYEAFINREMNFFSGPQFYTCLYRTETSDRLALKASHIATDAAGVKDIAFILSSIYNHLEHDPNYRPTPNSTRFRSFWHILRHVPWYVYPRIFFNYLKELFSSAIPFKSHSLPIQNTPAKSGKYIIKHINREKTVNLINYAKDNNATINDLLLAAIFRALARIGEWDIKAALRLTITVDLRRYLPTGKAKSLSNFSGIEIVTFGKDLGEDFQSTLIRVMELMSKRKASWLGLSQFVSTTMTIWLLPFSILKILASKGWKSKSNSSGSTDLFTNMGQIPLENVSFGGPPTSAWLLPPGCRLPILFFGCSGYNGSLRLSASVPHDSENEFITDQFFDFMIAELPVEWANTLNGGDPAPEGQALDKPLKGG